jgi:hydroxymethylpyrimidine pyrophosphatase-like HAD family hydrolase
MPGAPGEEAVRLVAGGLGFQDGEGMTHAGREGQRPAVRVAVVDIDGCLIRDVGEEWNWAALQAVRDLNRRARQGEGVPAVTLCTGRPQPYVEVLMQAIAAFLPGIYEHGGGLYFPDRFRFAEHPSITAELRHSLGEARSRIQERLVAPGWGYFQPGKEVSLTLLPHDGVDVGALHARVNDLLAEEGLPLHAQLSTVCVDITPLGIDKGEGVRWLAREIGVPLAQMGGIGDSHSDLPFLRLVGRSAAPRNATAEVQAAVGYVSAHENGEGVVDILQRWSGTAA